MALQRDAEFLGTFDIMTGGQQSGPIVSTHAHGRYLIYFGIFTPPSTIGMPMSKVFE